MQTSSDKPGERAYDLVVIGGGAAGMVATAAGAGLGARTLLLERADRLGGECSWTGCVPSKALIHTASVVQLLRAHGAPAAADDLSAAALDETRRVTEDIAHQTNGRAKLKAQGAEILLNADARITGSHRVAVNGRAVSARRLVIATGSRPVEPDIDGLRAAGFHTNATLFNMNAPPRSLAIIGAGPIGVEMAQAFCRLGTRVTLLSQSERILPRDDAELTGMLADILRAEGVDVRLGVRVERVERRDGVRVVHYSGGDSGHVEADGILVAVGRTANVESLGLEAAGITGSGHGLRTSPYLRTGAGWVFGAGDVLGHHQFSHTAEHEATTAIRNAFFVVSAKPDYARQPWATFTDPELAHLGPTEAELQAQGVRYEALRYDFQYDDRALVDRAGFGMVKLLCTPLGRLLGAHILGPRAGELMNELTLTMRKRGGVLDLAFTTHIYPTLGLSIQRAADGWIENKAHQPAVRPLLEWFTRRA